MRIELKFRCQLIAISIYMIIIIYTDGGKRTVPGENETEQPDHSTSLGDSITSSTRIRFSVHTRGTPRWPGGSCRSSLRRSAGCVDTGLDPASKEGNMKSRAGDRASSPHEHGDIRDR